jgi:cellulose synthase/poly-beta-1,6-N-acetylglucosamine synthase-like glycosyltransferase
MGVIWLFLGFFLILLYIYFGYPLVLRLLPGRRWVERIQADVELPKVSVLTAAHNEEIHISNKVRNVLEQEYPPEKCEIIVSSDGSVDRTVEIARSFQSSRVKVVENTERGGKNSALNNAIDHAAGEILIFTDANAMFGRDAILKLVNRFQDPEIGLVCGNLRYLKEGEANVGKGEGLYFRYESLLKELESRLGAVAVVTGSIYAIRRTLWEPLESDVANDFAHPVQVGAMGYKVVFEREAVAWEKTTASKDEEFKRRTRIVTRGFTAFGKYWRKYRMLRGLRGFCFVSHKLLRWFAPFFMIGLLCSNVFLEGGLFKTTLFLQLAFYCFALCGAFVESRVFVVPLYFCMINLAALVGFFNYLRGGRKAVWDVAKTTR